MNLQTRVFDRLFRFASRCAVALCFSGFGSCLVAAPAPPTREPLVRVADFAVGETQEVRLSDGSKARVKLVEVNEEVDSIRRAVRQARVKVEVNGSTVELKSGNYNLPVAVGGVRIDCSVTRGYNTNSGEDAWGLLKDARLRLWAGTGPLIAEGTFTYPLKQRWFASGSQMANEPTHVDGGEQTLNKKIYYHNDLDFGGCEGMVEVVAATNGLVVSAGTSSLPGYADTPTRPRYDVVYVLDDRGWYYRYSHLFSIDSAIQPGAVIKMGQKIGVLGKEGGSGGWSHLHFGIKSRQPSGKWGTQEAYAFVWEAYVRQNKPRVIAVARPHRFAGVGEVVTLDGSKSWSAAGKIARYDWTLTDGAAAKGAVVQRRYEKPGVYSEILKVTGEDGAIGYDFAVVHIVDPTQPSQLPPSIQAAYAPSLGVRAGDPVTFKVRTFRTTDGTETWNFGDGSPPVTVQSDGNVKTLAKDGFAVTQHRFGQPGDYIVRVERSNARGEKAMAHLYVRID
ncbi:MAG: hypothetical protein RIQ93_2329 [Verrucomicrobiota bacterium]|jgi:hypothetical protein